MGNRTRALTRQHIHSQGLDMIDLLREQLLLLASFALFEGLALDSFHRFACYLRLHVGYDVLEQTTP